MWSYLPVDDPLINKMALSPKVEFVLSEQIDSQILGDTVRALQASRNPSDSSDMSDEF